MAPSHLWDPWKSDGGVNSNSAQALRSTFHACMTSIFDISFNFLKSKNKDWKWLKSMRIWRNFWKFEREFYCEEFLSNLDFCVFESIRPYFRIKFFLRFLTRMFWRNLRLNFLFHFLKNSNFQLISLQSIVWFQRSATKCFLRMF